MGFVEKRADQRWRARVRVAGRERSRTFTTQGAAKKWLRKAEKDIDDGRWVDPDAGKISFDKWVTEYQSRTSKRPTTAARDTVVLSKWWSSALGTRSLRTITPVDVRTVVAKMIEELAPATVRTNYGVVRAVFSSAVEAELIARSPCRGIKMPEAERAREIRFLSAGELLRLADAIDPRYRVTVFLGGVIGLRWSELAGLRVSDIDLKRATVAVVQTVAEVNGKVLMARPKSKMSTRVVPAPAVVVNELREHLEHHHNGGELLMSAPEGGPLRRSSWRQRTWAPAVAQADLEGLTFHGLRHSAVGLLIEAEAHPRVIQQRLGHSTIRVTMDTYGHVLASVDEEVTNALDDVLRR